MKSNESFAADDLTKLKFSSSTEGEITFQKCLRCKLNDFLFIHVCCQPCKLEGGGLYIGITLSVRLSVQNGSSSYLSYRGGRIEIDTSQKYNMTCWCIMTLTSGPSHKIKNTCRKSANFVSYPYLLFLEDMRSCYSPKACF